MPKYIFDTEYDVVVIGGGGAEAKWQLIPPRKRAD